MIEVLKPGPLALVEDSGRFGLAAIGVGRSGAFDRTAFAEGAGLVDNDVARHAAIEVTLGGLVVRSAAHHTIALTGAECPVRVNGETAAWDTVLSLRPADVLTLGTPIHGLRSYLSVAGGIEVPPVLGSRSTDLLSGLGPARLSPGDFLPVGGDRPSPSPTAYRWSSPSRPPAPEATTHRWSSPSRPPALEEPQMLDLLPGPRTDWLADPDALAGEWLVSPDSNRIGVRLTGPAFHRTPEFDGAELPSEPLVRGAVQLPPSGQPVLFGPDHPTTGGYPVIAVLTELSSDRLAQCRPGAKVRLVWAAPPLAG